VNAAPPGRSARLLSIVAAVSGLYDIGLAAALLLARPWLVRAFGLPPPVPAIHADLNGLFALAIGVGYVLPYRRPDTWRAYLWLMGPFLKGLGAALFVADYLLRGSPASFLLFAAGDGTLAVWTLWALTVDSRSRQSSVRIDGHGR
jgi:hypothetical protein